MLLFRRPFPLAVAYAFTAMVLPAATSRAKLHQASDARFRYEGRIDHAQPEAPVLIWSGSQVSAEFTGEALTVVFGASSDQSVFNVTVDEQTEIVDVRAGRPEFCFAWPHGLATGRHRLAIFKRSEASKGHAAFLGVELARTGELRKSAAPESGWKLIAFTPFGSLKSKVAGAAERAPENVSASRLGSRIFFMARF